MKPDFKEIIQKLKAYYGAPKSPVTRDPFEMILLENVAYLVDDERRERIFVELRNTVGTKPTEIFKHH